MQQRYSCIVLLLSVLAATPLRAQNIVPNPSFDIQDSCPAVSELFVAQPWDSPTLGTPDAFNSTCPTQNGPGHTGIGSAGVYIYSTFPDNREYMQAPLSGTLVAGQTYCVSFWVRRSDFRLACDRIGAHLRAGAFQNNATTGVLNFAPQVENASGNVLGGTGWHLISGSFTAAGGEDHILIGNFRNDATTTTVVANSGNTSEVCYYRVDDVVVQACQVGVEESVAIGEVVVAPQPAAETMWVTLSPPAADAEIALFDLSGRMVMSTRSVGATDALDVRGLPEGGYVLTVRTAGYTRTQRVMIGGR